MKLILQLVVVVVLFNAQTNFRDNLPPYNITTQGRRHEMASQPPCSFNLFAHQQTLRFYWNCTVVLSQSLGFLWVNPLGGLDKGITYIISSLSCSLAILNCWTMCSTHGLHCYTKHLGISSYFSLVCNSVWLYILHGRCPGHSSWIPFWGPALALVLPARYHLQKQ